MFVETQDINATELRDEVAEANRSTAVRPRLRVVHDADREREAQAIILRLLLTERPAELRTCAVMARIGEPGLAAGAIEELVDAGLVIRVDEYVLATAAAVSFHRLRPYMSRSS
ncbi:MAG: hypothetical protein JST08_19525 [Actinobacteria bacterium]|nr:hypothetical protein [Actinomycetota bacterium]